MLIHEIILCNLMVMNRPTWRVNIGLASPFQDVMKYTEILWNTHPVFMGHQVMNIEYISPGFNLKGGIKFRGNGCEMVAKMVDMGWFLWKRASQIPKYDRRFSQRNCNFGAFQRIPSVGLYIITILPQMNSDVIYQQIVIMVLSAPRNLTHWHPRN